VTLAAACLSMVGWAAPAWEATRAEGPVAALVVGARSARAASPVKPEPPKPRASRARAPAPAPRPGFRATGALFVLHRALLR